MVWRSDSRRGVSEEYGLKRSASPLSHRRLSESSQEFIAQTAQTAVVEHDHEHKGADCGACVHNDDELEELLGPPDWLEDFAQEKKAEHVDDQLRAAGENNSKMSGRGRWEVDISLLQGDFHREVVSRRAVVVDDVAEWQNGRMAEWQNGRMAEWQNGRMAE